MKPDVLDGGIYGVRVEGQVEILELEMLSFNSMALRELSELAHHLMFVFKIDDELIFINLFELLTDAFWHT